jgi:hypothetical protein
LHRYTGAEPKEDQVAHRDLHSIDFDQIVAESRQELVGERRRVLHAMYCSACDLREEALSVLTLLGWDETDYIEACLAAETLAEHSHD